MFSQSMIDTIENYGKYITGQVKSYSTCLFGHKCVCWNYFNRTIKLTGSIEWFEKKNIFFQLVYSIISRGPFTYWFFAEKTHEMTIC